MSCEVHPCLHFVPVWSKAMQLGSCLEADAYERDLRELRQSIAGDMPRVVANQKEKFQNDEIFQKLSREGEVYKRNRSFRLFRFFSMLLCFVYGFSYRSAKLVQLKLSLTRLLRLSVLDQIRRL